MTRILVVEDDPSIQLGLRDTLRAKGYEVEAVGRGDLALAHLQRLRCALVILDVMLPDQDGFAVCKAIRALPAPTGRVPIIMLTARGAELDRVRGLELGADDYVTKPFSLMELIARVGSVLRRTGHDGGQPRTLRIGSIHIDLLRQTAHKDGHALEMPPRAFALLAVFARRPGQVVARDVLLDEAWGHDAYPNTRTVDNHLVRLRRVLEPDPVHPQYLLTVHGVGYRLAIEPDTVEYG